MNGAEVATLKWLADLLKSLTAGVLGEKLKPKTSDQRAWKLGESLWASLEHLRYASDYFVAMLRIATKSIAECSAMENAPAGQEPDHETGINRRLESIRQREQEILASLKLPSKSEPSAWAPALEYCMDRVIIWIQRVNMSLDAINPQLRIHAPEIEEVIARSNNSRAEAVTAARIALDELLRGNSLDSQLPEIVRRAEASALMISEATERMRAFLATQFTFKESF
jgi:hypothetical protein